MPHVPNLRGPLLLTAAGLVAALAMSFGYTTWAVASHSQQACTELRIIAAARGATSPYDKTIREQYRHLYALRCR